jgi:hypothetical protein
MNMLCKALAGALALAACPLAAQVPNPSLTPELPQDRGYDKDTGKHEAVDAQEAPVTRDLNNVAEQQAAGSTIAGEVDQEQYRTDLEAYHAAVMANRADAMRDEVRFERQQRAYADAMAQWRYQVRQCEKGSIKSCKLPTPNPADYY